MALDANGNYVPDGSADAQQNPWAKKWQHRSGSAALSEDLYEDTYMVNRVIPNFGSLFEPSGSNKLDFYLCLDPGDEIVDVAICFTEATLESPALLAGNNLSDVLDTVAARGEIGVEEIAPVPVEGESAIATTPSTQRLFVDASSGAVTVVLYHHLTYGAREIDILKSDSSGNAVTIEADVSSSINGAATQVLAAQYDFLRLAPGSSGWFIVGTN